MIIDAEVQVSNVDATDWKKALEFTATDAELNSVYVRIITGPQDLGDRLEIDIRPIFDLAGTDVEGAPENRVHRRYLTELPDMISINQEGIRVPAFSVWVKMAERSVETITTLGVAVAHGT